MTREPLPSGRFHTTVEPTTGRLDLIGELDLAGAQQFRDASAAILAGGSAEVLVDLARLRFIDAGGIGLLVALRNELAAREASTQIVNFDVRASQVFSLCGLDAMLTTTSAA